MKSQTLARILAVALTALTLTSLSDAGTRSRSGRYQTTRGRTGTVSQTTTRAPGTMHREITVSGDGGKTATRTIDRTRDPETGTETFSRTTTGPEGRVRRAEGTVTNNRDGTASTTGTYLRASGETGAFTAETARTANGRITTGSATSANGQTGTFTREVSHHGNTTTNVESVTGPNGKSVTSDATRVRDGDSIANTRTVTGPRGQEYTGSVTVTQDPAGATAP